MAFNTAHFARMPEAKKPHTLFKRPGVHAGTMLHGDIVPAYCKLCSPGEVINEHIVGNIRMFPLGPLYSSIKVSFNAFFIPLRLVWAHTNEFFGENKTASGPQTNTYVPPHRTINNIATGNNSDKIRVYSVSHYLGKPLFKGSSIDSLVGYNGPKVSILKERAYWLTVSEWYRHEQIMNPVILDTSDLGNIGTLDGSNLEMRSYCQKCCKDFDYFTTMTRTPQYGPDVTLPLGATAPVITGPDFTLGTSNPALHLKVAGTSADPGNSNIAVAGTTGALSTQTGSTSIGGAGALAPVNLYADLSNATSATIDELYLSMAAQAWYHNANYGSKYFEMLQVHYGVYNPDLVMDRPEHIGEAKRFIQVQQVLATAETSNGGKTTALGTPGANSSTNIDIKFPRYACGEWGYYLVLMNTYHERYYPAGVQREDLYMEMFDFFFPEFANIGDMGVKEIEAFYTSASDEEKLIGFQESWADMRYTPNRLSGLLDPYADANINSSYGNALSQWTLGEKWGNAPTFSKQFILENRDAFKNASINGIDGPDYIFYLYFDEKTLSEVPLFSVPGLPGRGRGL